MADIQPVDTPFELGPIQKKWIAALREHPERQGKAVLGKGTPDHYTACCLGEGGLVAGTCMFVDGYIVEIGLAKNGYSLRTSYPALGLYTMLGESVIPTMPSLAGLNDSGSTWPEIADILERYPSCYFKESK